MKDDMMRAVVMNDFGGPEVLAVQEVDRPVTAAGDVLIKVQAAGINPVDCKTRMAPRWGDRKPPMILGFDVAGVIEELGSGVTGFSVGDEVYASPALVRDGGYAEYVAVDARTVAAKPKSISFEEAAAVPLAIITAWEALHDHARMQPGETVLIFAGAGGVGHLAIQLAKAFGCRVIATAGRDESIAFCREMGADEVLDYRTDVVGERVADVVFDCVGGELFNQAIAAVKVKGRVVTIVPGVPGDQINALFGKNASLHFEFMGSAMMNNAAPETQGEILRNVAELIDAGAIKPHIFRTYSLDEVADAHRQQESQRTMGKLVVRVV
jgi:NADPH2:quinone reductase